MLTHVYMYTCNYIIYYDQEVSRMSLLRLRRYQLCKTHPFLIVLECPSFVLSIYTLAYVCARVRVQGRTYRPNSSIRGNINILSL